MIQSTMKNQDNETLARVALLQVGFDATADECNRYWKICWNDVEISSSELQQTKLKLEKADPGRKYYTKADIAKLNVLLLLASDTGLYALRSVLADKSQEELIILLNLKIAAAV
jgi:hypothetical protein